MGDDGGGGGKKTKCREEARCQLLVIGLNLEQCADVVDFLNRSPNLASSSTPHTPGLPSFPFSPISPAYTGSPGRERLVSPSVYVLVVCVAATRGGIKQRHPSQAANPSAIVRANVTSQ